ncbi:MAG: hypothetical protein R6V03_04765 [Kiritimatiellia bacterium]
MNKSPGSLLVASAWILASTMLQFSVPHCSAAEQGLSAEEHVSNLKRIVGDHASATNVLDERYIHVTSGGKVGVDFDIVCDLTPQVELVSKVARRICEADFHIRGTDKDDAYVFENEDGETSDIFLLYQKIGTNSCESVSYVTGERFFGSFKALIHVVTTPVEGEGAEYKVDLYAYPESSTVRFLVRNIGIVRRYFRSKALEITEAANRASVRIVNDPEFVLNEIGGCKNPEEKICFSDEEEEFIRELYRIHGIDTRKSDAGTSVLQPR